MATTSEKYLAVLRLELADVQHDIEALIEGITKERESGELTNYVFLENLALFRNELLAVNAFDRILDKVDPVAHAELHELVDYVRTSFRAQVEAGGFAEAIIGYVERKLDKVERYVDTVE